LVASVDLVGGCLKQVAHHGIGGFKYRCADQHFQLLDGGAARRPGLKTVDQLLDFLLLRQDDRGWLGFF
jgi:hypothetical protein